MLYHLENLEAFVFAVEQGSFTAAAKRLGKSQATISQLINYLEIDTGLTLFDRTGKAAVLTNDGKAIIEQAKQILILNQKLGLKISELHAGIEDHVVIAIDPLFHSPIFDDCISRLLEQYDQSNITIYSKSSAEIWQLVTDREIDFAIGGDQLKISAEFGIESIAPIQYDLICTSDHPLVSLDRPITTEDLSQYPQVGNLFISGIDELQYASINHPGNIYFNHPEQIVRYVERGHGYGFIPSFKMKMLPANSRIVSISDRYVDYQESWFTQMWYAKHRPLGSILKALRDELRQIKKL